MRWVASGDVASSLTHPWGVVKVKMKNLTREEMIEWLESSKLPLKLSVTQLTPDMLIMRRMNKKNQGLTPHQEIMLRELIR